jgi:protein-L-isoaspartate(D-aspartate) O-methyltransferase
MDFERARFNMIEQQIRPWDVLDQDVLNLFATLRREDFVPPAWRAMAFTDMEVPLVLDGAPTGECMFPPRLEARLLQSLAPRRHEHVLEVGTGSGFMAALLASRARRVLSLEIHEGLAAFGRENLRRAGLRNVTVEVGNGAQPPGTDTFDAIVLSGAVAFVPDALLRRLAPGGRLIALVGEEPAMTARLYTRTGEDAFAEEGLFETVVRPLKGFPRKERFVF